MRDNNNGNGRIRIVDLIIMEMIEGIIDLTKNYFRREKCRH